ncbi:MAG TPA: ATP-binding cassette domain-containing protein, partial [Planctomycetota bacterium]|nr:ATP-binding cassette domain-containing protein [Planctomycetota bacterium]
FCAAYDITFDVPVGQVVGFLGPNGAGKTTTMRVITGFFPASRGQVWIDGLSIIDNPLEARAKIGYLPESNPLYTELTVKEYLSFRAKIKGVAAKDRTQAIDEAMAATDCRPRQNQVIGTLSKGFRQRVGLADAIVARPRLLILDEPTSGLDPMQQIEVRKLIRHLAEKATVVLSTHILQEVEKVCDRVLIIHRGRLVPEDEIARRKRAREIRLVARGERVGLEAALAAALGPQVAVEYLGAKNAALEHVWRIVPDHGEDLRETIVAAVQQRKAADPAVMLLEVTPNTLGLEYVFAQLVGQIDPELERLDPAAATAALSMAGAAGATVGSAAR